MQETRGGNRLFSDKIWDEWISSHEYVLQQVKNIPDDVETVVGMREVVYPCWVRWDVRFGIRMLRQSIQWHLVIM